MSNLQKKKFITMIKRDATYRVTVFKPNSEEEPVVVEYPLTCHFNCQRATFSQSNQCTIELYNVSPEKRKRIFKDIFTDLNEENWKFIKLEAGWNGALSQIFYGRIMTAYSSKSGGQTDVITRIDSIPFDIFNMQTDRTFSAGTSYREAYKSMAGDLPNCQLGNLGNFDGEFKTQTTYSGNTLSCMNELTGGHTYVDNGVLNTIMGNEVVDVPIPLLTDQNGLLETPKRRQASITIKTLFEPTLIVGQLLEVQSQIQPEFNGQWKVVGFSHDCLISPTQAGQRITTIDLLNIPMAFHSNINLTGEKVIEGVNKVKNETVTKLDTVPVDNEKWLNPITKGFRVTSFFGKRNKPNKKASSNHQGIDIGVPIGTSVKASKTGTVSLRNNPGGYGKYIDIDHGTINGIKAMSRYGHLSKFCVANGQKVKQGQVIALSGNTGNSTGPHLHFEIRINGSPVNPLQYIS